MTAPDRGPDRRAAERAVARRWHPDVGGDAEIYIRQMRRIAAEYGDTDHSENVITAEGFARARRWKQARKAVRRGARGVRAAVPSGWPGARTYGHL